MTCSGRTGCNRQDNSSEIWITGNNISGCDGAIRTYNTLVAAAIRSPGSTLVSVTETIVSEVSQQEPKDESKGFLIVNSDYSKVADPILVRTHGILVLSYRCVRLPYYTSLFLL